MKTSEMINELVDCMRYNGDQDLVVMIYGKRFTDIEINAEDELYIEAYIKDQDEENSFIEKYVNKNGEWIR